MAECKEKKGFPAKSGAPVIFSLTLKIMEFLGCKIITKRKVFRPRPETCFWVGEAQKEIKNNKKKSGIKVLDIFSGSGCVGISILMNVQGTRVDFVDISSEALAQIKENVLLNRIAKNRYKVIKSDMFKKVKGKYDFIFANPPYVALNRLAEVQKEVLKKDPHLALFGGKEGMLYIEILLNKAKKHLGPGAKIFIEYDPLQKENIKKILEMEKYEYTFKKDQFKKFRWLKAWLRT